MQTYFRETTKDWSMIFTRRGASAKRTFQGDYTSVMAQCPKPYDAHPSYPALTVDTVSFKPLAGPVEAAGYGGPIGQFSEVEISVDYTLDYRKPGLNDPPRVTWDYASEFLNTMAGRTWGSDGARIDATELSQATPYTNGICTIDLCVRSIDWETIRGAISKINTDAWKLQYTEPRTGGIETLLDVEAETMLYQGPATDVEYDFDSMLWIHRISHKFLWRPRSHNLVWRPADRLWDDDQKTWVQDPVSGKYQFAPGSVGMWDTEDPLLYELTDFAPLVPTT